MCAPRIGRVNPNRAILVALILAAVPWVSLPAEEPSPLPPAWACLPDHTLLVLRCPNVAAFADALVKQTKWGAAMNDPQRWKSALSYLAQQCGTELEEVERKLAAYDLKIDDWRAYASAEIGYAVIADEQLTAFADGKLLDLPGSEQHTVYAAWFEPNDELGGRIWKAWNRWTEQAVADHANLKRVDETLADTTVMRLSAQDPPLPFINLGFSAGLSGRGLSLDLVNYAKKKEADQPPQILSENHLLVARVGQRFLLVHNVPDEFEDVEQARADSAASLERCRQAMAGLLERHRQRSQPSPWLRVAMSQTPRDGATLFELFGNLPLFSAVALKYAEQDTSDAQGKMPAFALDIWNICKPAIAGVGAVVMRGSLQENRWERSVHVGLAPERAGLLSLFDAGTLPTEPPAWVPSTAQSYTQINLDAAPIAEQLRVLFRAARQDPDIGGALALIEGQWHIDPAELICGLGPRLSFVEFADPPEGKQRVGPSDAVLWQVRNDEQWQKGLEAAAGSLGQKLFKRDGYVGMQIPMFDDKSNAKQSKKWSPWLLAGHGHLLFVWGDDPTGPPLANLPQPAAGESNFRDSRTFQRAAEIFPGEACFAFQCVDRSTQDQTARWLNYMISQLSKLRLIPYTTAEGKSTRAWSREWWSRLLGEEATATLLTVEADRLTIEPDGVLHRTVLEFVPPER